MLTVFLFFAARDRSAAEAIANRLRLAELRVVLEQIADYTLPTAWEAGTGAAGIILVLSAHSVPRRLSRDDWSGLLRHVEANEEPQLVSVQTGDCQFPLVLRRTRFFGPDLDKTLRELLLWAARLHPENDDNFVPAVQHAFSGRETEMSELWTALVDDAGYFVISGAKGTGKTSLAQEFARQASRWFRTVFWVACRDRSKPCILAEVASQFGIRWHETAEESVLDAIGKHRVLLVLDSLQDERMFGPPQSAMGSVLITREFPCEGIAGVHLASVPDTLCGRPEAPEERALWEAMTVCRRDEASLDLAAAIADIPRENAAAAARALVEKRLLDPLDDVRSTFRVSHRAEIEDRENELRRRHALWISRTFPEHVRGTSLPEARSAFQWARQHERKLAVLSGRQIVKFLLTANRTEEALELLSSLEADALQTGDQSTLDFVNTERSWITGSPWSRAGASARVRQLRFSFEQ